MQQPEISEAEVQQSEISEAVQLDVARRAQPPRAPNAKVEILMRRAAALLGIPEAQIVDLAKSSEHLSFRRACIAFLLSAAGLDRKDIAGALRRSATWVDESINGVKARIAVSAPFRMNLEGMVEDMGLGSPVTARFRAIRRVLVNHHGFASTAGELTIAAALLTLSDALVGTDEVDD